MRTFLAIALVTVLALFILSACGGNENDNDTNDNNTTQPTETEQSQLESPNYITIQGEQFSTTLTEIRLSGRQLTSADIEPLRYMVNLRRLHLSANGISDISSLAGLINLEFLDLEANLLLYDLTPLAELVNLTELRVANRFSDWSPVAHVETVSGRPDNWQEMIVVAQEPTPPVMGEPTTQEPAPPVVAEEPIPPIVEEPMPQIGRVTAVSAGNAHSLAIDQNGTLWAWGENQDRQLGLAPPVPIDGGGWSPEGIVMTNTPMISMENVVFAAAGNAHSLAIDQNGTLWAWGSARFSDIAIADRHIPVKVMENVVFATAGARHSLIIDQNGGLWAWGDNSSGQLGDGTRTNSRYPVHIMDNVVHASAGGFTSLAIDQDGVLWGWGTGGVGDASTTRSIYPMRIMDNIVYALAGPTAGGFTGHAFAIDYNGNLWAWGSNSNGQLGDGTTTNRYFSEPVHIMDNVIYVSARTSGSIAIDKNGNLWAWGTNSRGQLGDGTTTGNFSPVHIMDNVAYASMSGSHTLAIDRDGNLWAWGDNGRGRLGDGTWSTRYYPVRITGN